MSELSLAIGLSPETMFMLDAIEWLKYLVGFFFFSLGLFAGWWHWHYRKLVLRLDQPQPDASVRPRTVEAAIRALGQERLLGQTPQDALAAEENTAEEDAAEEDAAEEDAAEEDAAEEDAAEEDAAEEDAAEEDAAEEDAAEEDAAEEDAAEEDAAEEDAAEEDAAEEDAAEEDAAEGDAAEGDAAEGDAAEGDAAEGDAAEGDAAEGDTAEGDAAEGGATKAERGKFGLVYATAPDEIDNLQLIRGIGRASREKLNGIGIYQFKQIASWGAPELAAIAKELQFTGQIAQFRWVEQAKLLEMAK